MSRSVASIFGKQERRVVPFVPVQWPIPEQLVGLEIEVENTSGIVHPVAYETFWNKVKDGSLRSGSEYVLKMPLKGDTLTRAIHDLYHGTKFERTTTGSTHIHLDMLESQTSHEVTKLLVLMMFVFEGAIFAIADKGREWCGYTNKLASAPDVLVGSVLNASEDNGYNELVQTCLDRHGLGRYYGINVMALAKYGSLEFRYFPTATSAEELIEWVHLMQTFKLAAMQLGTAQAFLDTVENEELYDRFLSTYLPRYKDVFIQEVPQYQAVASAHKAMAIAASHSMVSMSKPLKYDEKAITGNKMLAKFVKNKAKTRVNPLLIVTNADPVPSARECPVGTVMLHGSGRVYIASPHDWVGFPYNDDGYNGITQLHRNRALASIRRYMATAETQMASRGYSVQNIMNGVRRLNDAGTVLAQTVGEEYVPHLCSLENPVRAPRPSYDFGSSNPFASTTPAPTFVESEDEEPSDSFDDFEDEGDDE